MLKNTQKHDMFMGFLMILMSRRLMLMNSRIVARKIPWERHPNDVKAKYLAVFPVENGKMMKKHGGFSASANVDFLGFFVGGLVVYPRRSFNSLPWKMTYL
jgi:hypothetical protein